MTAQLVALALMVGAAAAYLLHMWWSGVVDPSRTPTVGSRRPRTGRQTGEQPWRLDVAHLREATPRTGRR